MPLKVLIAPDKFKGTLTAPAAAEAMAKGWRKSRPTDAFELLPMSDGGDGFGHALSELLGARAQTIKTVDAAHRACRATWWWEPKSRTAIIESANVVGLAQLPPREFHPFGLDTVGLGAVLRAAAAKGARRCLVGIGGSATNDGGFGVALALGWKFIDGAGQPITSWAKLDSLAKIIPPRKKRWFQELIVAVDVQNLLLGARGCTRIYGPQKGLTPPDFPHAERCLRRMAALATARKGTPKFLDAHGEKGDGAAGGLGFGLRVFLGAKLRPGFDLFARKADLAKRLRGVDLVITGEGSIDHSTMMGKGVGQLAERCAKLKIPCLGLAGIVVREKLGRKKYFTQVHGMTDLTASKNAKANAAVWLERLAEKISANWLGE